MNTPDNKPDEANPSRPALRTLRFRGHVAVWSGVGVLVSVAGLFLLTGLASSPWLFLLYPVLIGTLLLSLGSLALFLLHRF